MYCSDSLGVTKIEEFRATAACEKLYVLRALAAKVTLKRTKYLCKRKGPSVIPFEKRVFKRNEEFLHDYESVYKNKALCTPENFPAIKTAL